MELSFPRVSAGIIEDAALHLVRECAQYVEYNTEAKENWQGQVRFRVAGISAITAITVRGQSKVHVFARLVDAVVGHLTEPRR